MGAAGTSGARELALALLAFMRKHEALYGGLCPCGICWHGVVALSQFTGGAIALSLDEFEQALLAAEALSDSRSALSRPERAQ